MTAPVVVADLDGEPVLLDDIETILARMRHGPHAALLPREDGAEGRQLRRWLVQMVTVDRLIEAWADRQGIDAGEDDLRPWRPDTVTGLELGSVTCAVLVSSARARAVFREVTSGVEVLDAEVRESFARRAAGLGRPARAWVRYRLFPDAESALEGLGDTSGIESLGWVRVGQFAGALGEAIAAAVPGMPTQPVPFAGGWAVVLVGAVEPAVRPAYEEHRGAIHAELLAAARRHAFAGWLDGQRQARVRLRPGFEHPADDRQPDNTHRH